MLVAAIAIAGGAATPREASPNEAAGNVGGTWVHAYAAFGKPKYPPGFAHFDYVNPEAPKGGTLNLNNPDRQTSFDKFNPYTVKGNYPTGVRIFMFETLAVMAGDELSTMYGLLAESMLVAPDKSSLTLRIHPLARFANGDPVTAADVKHSFDMLTSKHADPTTQTRLSGVQGAVVLDARTIRFDLKDRSNDTIFNVGTRLPVFSRKWGARCRTARSGISIRSSTITRSPAARTRLPSPIPGDGSNSRATRTTGRATSVYAADCSISTGSSIATTRTTRSRWRRSRPANSTFCRSIRRAAGRASTRDRNGATAVS